MSKVLYFENTDKFDGIESNWNELLPSVNSISEEFKKLFGDNISKEQLLEIINGKGAITYSGDGPVCDSKVIDLLYSDMLTIELTRNKVTPPARARVIEGRRSDLIPIFIALGSLLTLTKREEVDYSDMTLVDNVATIAPETYEALKDKYCRVFVESQTQTDQVTLMEAAQNAAQNLLDFFKQKHISKDVFGNNGCLFLENGEFHIDPYSL